VNVEMQRMSDALTTQSGESDGRRGCREMVRTRPAGIKDVHWSQSITASENALIA
jgi:hypothetical protein